MVNKEKVFKLKGRTFVIDIKSTQDDTWKGTILWTQENREVSFRSTLELIRLIDSAVQTSEEGISWGLSEDK